MAIGNSPLDETVRAADMAALATQLSVLRTDIAKIAASVAGTAETRMQALGHDISDGMSNARDFAGRKGHDARVGIEHQVAANPLVSVGIAAGVGLLLGLMSRRWA